MSHAEVARRTEKALKRQEERQAEREQRRLRLAEARAARERGEVTPKPKRSRPAKPPVVQHVAESPKRVEPVHETPTPKRQRQRQRKRPVEPKPAIEGFY